MRKAIILLMFLATGCYGRLPDLEQESSSVVSIDLQITERELLSGEGGVSKSEDCFGIGRSKENCTDTKSSITIDESQIRNLHLLLYSEGRLDNSLYISEYSGNIRMKTVAGRKYRLYALANCGDDGMAIPETEKELLEFRHKIGSIKDIEKNGVPLAGIVEFVMPAAPRTIVLKMQRLIAKFNFSISKELFDGIGIEVRSVRLCQSPTDVGPFQPNSCATEVSNGDYASAQDLDALNKGEAFSFYMLENCQGRLLPDNSDPWAKIPASIPEKEKLCTYIETECVFKDNPAVSGSVKYRFYLGDDNTSDFNVRRNTESRILLVPDAQNLFRVSWKIEKDLKIDDIVLDFRDTVTYICKQFTLHPTTDDLNAGMTYRSSNENVARIERIGNTLSLTVTGTGVTELSFRVKRLSNLWQETKYHITSKAPVLSPSMTLCSLDPRGSLRKFTLTYTDGMGHPVYNDNELKSRLFKSMLETVSYTTGDNAYIAVIETSGLSTSSTGRAVPLDFIIGGEKEEDPNGNGEASAGGEKGYLNYFKEDGVRMVRLRDAGNRKLFTRAYPNWEREFGEVKLAVPNCVQVDTASIELKVSDPLPYDKYLGRIDIYTLLKGNPETFSFDMDADCGDVNWLLYDSEDYKYNPSVHKYETDSGIIDGKTTIILRLSGYENDMNHAYPTGRCHFQGEITNGISGEKWVSPSQYHFDAYMHVAASGRLVLPSMAPAYVTVDFNGIAMPQVRGLSTLPDYMIVPHGLLAMSGVTGFGAGKSLYTVNNPRGSTGMMNFGSSWTTADILSFKNNHKPQFGYNSNENYAVDKIYKALPGNLYFDRYDYRYFIVFEDYTKYKPGSNGWYD